MKNVTRSVLIILIATCCGKQPGAGTDGALPFEVNGDAKAMPSFEQGLLLLHNFEYPDARDAFVDAQKTDSTFVMAYWGEAMTFNHPVWRLQELDEARQALRKLGATREERLSKAKTALEKDFIASLDILYGEGSKTQRDKAYAAFMASLYKKYPGHHEVALFYSLSLLGLADGFDKDYNLRSAEIAQAVLKENPKHPGALHYLIHADDHPEYAQRALDAANRYAKVASYAGHALHMPSHIYLALGMWDDVVESNTVSFQASVDRKAKKGLKNDALNYHGYLWLAYGYLQRGQYDSAKSLLDHQVRFTGELASTRARYHLAAMRGHYIVETGQWSNDLASSALQIDDLGLSARSGVYFIKGMKAYHEGNNKQLEEVISLIDAEVEKAKVLVTGDDGVALCNAYGNTPTQHDIEVSLVISSELKAVRALLKKDPVEAEKMFKASTAAEDAIGYFFGPPEIQKPSHELYGEYLLSTGRFQEAQAEFSKVLEKAPGRTLALKGALMAARKLNQEDKAAEITTSLEEVLKFAPPDVKRDIITAGI